MPGSAPTQPAPPAPAQPPASAPSAENLQALTAVHDEVAARWLDYELDVTKLIAFPAMSDGRQPLTAAFLRAKKVADRRRPAAGAKITRDQFVEYRDAVTDFEVAFDVAERDARRIKDASFTEAERKRLGTAKQLLTVAIDQAATPAERQLAYRRVREELDGLILLSDDAIDVLEQKVALELAPNAQDASARPRKSGSDSAHRPPAPPAAARAAPGPSERPPAGGDEPWPIPARSPRPPQR